MTTATELVLGRRYDFHTSDQASYLKHELVRLDDNGAVLIRGPIAHVYLARHELDRVDAVQS